ncbi:MULTISPECIES: DNRLRE domain-containing protein [unclassified Lentimonas]|uniref:CBM96 family carbohydrate-binding protein n=1 Tax=unclassified Lentimonas TaxID=2630993 RepID=UPI0013286611|nr:MULTISPECIES: DNRLRE domain-containing protein [unclassified Lentimonas]CAA6678838.1 Unannotated [Lentimonas sp. CC4]CAA6684442.1 Unannotated [Lentimonas sp. CC6]CAA7077479.1 Unannotated [Lentimonas sp. CC4]CAA7171313.1 Unannotated [Lentimonas sp. CC21]CAA7183343.1 Unannotated [Lentimonas sp. CC8]
MSSQTYFRRALRASAALCAGLSFTQHSLADIQIGEPYILESRLDGWVLQEQGSSLGLASARHDGSRRFIFNAAGGNLFTIQSESDGTYVTVAGGGVTEGTSIGLEALTGADSQLWEVVDLGDQHIQIVNPASGLLLGHSEDTTPENPVDHDGLGVLSEKNGEYDRQWRPFISEHTPTHKLGVNHSGYAPAQQKVVTLTRDALATVNFTVTGPQQLSGVMSYWGNQWGLHFYQADLTSLTTEGQYTLTADGLTQHFTVSEDAMRSVRAENGGELSWSDFVDGFLATQVVPTSGDTIDEANGEEYNGYTQLTSQHTLTGGFYDATSRDSKMARTGTAAKYLSLSHIYAGSTEQSATLTPVLQDLVDHFQLEQNTDGSFPLGKFRISPTVYLWSTDTDAGVTARVGTGLALLAQALDGVDATRSAGAQAAAEDAWDYVQSSVDANGLPNNFTVLGNKNGEDYRGAQSNVINLATELYLLTGAAEYANYADARILEARYQGGIYKNLSSVDDWPGVHTNRQRDLTDSGSVLHLSRYHSVAASNVAAAIEVQMEDWKDYWIANNPTPWGVPENAGAAAVSNGWSRKLTHIGPQMLMVADVFGWQDARDCGTRSWDYILGNNAAASSYYMGARGSGSQPRLKDPTDESVGGVIPGIQDDNVGDGTLTLLTATGDSAKVSEVVTMHTLPMLLTSALGERVFPVGVGNHSPEVVENPLQTADALVGQTFVADLVDRSYDPDGDALTYTLLSGPSWLAISNAGLATGVPNAGESGSNVFSVQVSDGTASVDFDLEVFVRESPYFEAPADPILFVDVAEDTYSKSSSATTNFGTRAYIEVRTQASNSFSRNSFVKFSVPTVNGTIQDVKLFLYSLDEGDALEVYSVDSTWDEGALTWDNQPTAGALVGSFDPEVGIYSGLDVTSAVSADSTVSFMIKEVGDSVGQLGSREGSQGAFLEVTYVEPPANLPPVWNNSVFTQTGATADVAYTSYVNWRVSDPESDDLNYVKISGPAWLSISPDNGKLTGTPSVSDGGDNVFFIEVDDGINPPVAAEMTINVDVPAECSVSDIAVIAESTNGGKRHRGVASLTIVDAVGDPVAGATVDIAWSGAIAQTVSVVTDASGVATHTSDKVRNPGTFVLTVNSVTAAGLIYDPNDNVETSDSATSN